MNIMSDSSTTRTAIELSLPHPAGTAGAPALNTAIELTPELLDGVQGGVYVGPLSKVVLYILGSLGGII